MQKFTYKIVRVVTDYYEFEAHSVEEAKELLDEGLIANWEGDPTGGKDHVDGEALLDADGKVVDQW